MRNNSASSDLQSHYVVQAADGFLSKKKKLPTGRRNVRLRKQYLSFVETAPVVAFIFMERWTLSHCELPAAAQGRIF